MHFQKEKHLDLQLLQFKKIFLTIKETYLLDILTYLIQVGGDLLPLVKHLDLKQKVNVSQYYHTNYVTSPDIFMHPFCLTTSLHQPTGSLNFSRIENAKIHSETEILNDTIYAVNYNILRIENGMAGLLYAN